MALDSSLMGILARKKIIVGISPRCTGLSNLFAIHPSENFEAVGKRLVMCLSISFANDCGFLMEGANLAGLPRDIWRAVRVARPVFWAQE